MEEYKGHLERQEEMVEITIPYRISHDHFLAYTPCPYYRHIHRGTLTRLIKVGTVACDLCRWFCEKDMEANTVTCSIPKRLKEKYLRASANDKTRLDRFNDAVSAAKATGGNFKELLEVSEKEALKYKRKSRKGKKRNKAGDGSIFSEVHNHGMKYSNGVGSTRRSGHRWVATITVKGHRYRCRSYSYERCWAWLEAIKEELALLRKEESDNKEIKIEG